MATGAGSTPGLYRRGALPWRSCFRGARRRPCFLPMSLKILAGVYGGRVLRSVRGLGMCPLLGQVRAALFNCWAEQVPGAIVWDLFAGTGATGIEALSHGAKVVMFCEKNGRAIDVLRGNLQMLGQEAVEQSIVIRG